MTDLPPLIKATVASPKQHPQSNSENNPPASSPPTKGKETPPAGMTCSTLRLATMASGSDLSAQNTVVSNTANDQVRITPIPGKNAKADDHIQPPAKATRLKNNQPDESPVAPSRNVFTRILRRWQRPPEGEAMAASPKQHDQKSTRHVPRIDVVKVITGDNSEDNATSAPMATVTPTVGASIENNPIEASPSIDLKKPENKSESIINTSAWETLEETVAGDMDFLQELIHTFIEDAPALLCRMNDGLVGNDAAEVRMAAHSLKSNSAEFGAMELSSLCKEIEQLARDNRLPEIDDEIVDQARQQYGRVKEALTDRLSALAKETR